MPHENHLNEHRLVIAASFKLLGELFRSQPTNASLDAFFLVLQNAQLTQEWPLGDEASLVSAQQKMGAAQRGHELNMQHQALFIGPNHLEAPPWGSVYLDREQVVFGESEILLEQFLAEQGIHVDTGVHEPSDHIGLMCWYIAGFIEAGHDEALKILLEKHLLPWSTRYLELLKQHNQSVFYEGLAVLMQTSLQDLAALTQASAQPLPLYF